ncbi:RICIN domain-containing protein [Streptomyces sp. RKAG337]|uniref:RICIN domain-containing protein n=1 Tax=Streptomyces sp. RKAG337 TaxID=2893404 RepID=UPI0020339773|nr:RICIN domain-containing protein [Streptomyces sp. RKAG337]MCM2424588.1 RICIN domain-containing protein [Streptomyces sp. RKAG337]
MSALLLGGGLAAPASASASSPFSPRAANDAVEHYGNMATGSCLDDSEFGLRGYSCNGSNFQNWRVHVWNDATVQLRNVATGRCLYDDGGTLTTRGCDSSPQQSWTATHHRASSISLQSQATQECLDDSEFGLRTLGCAGGKNDHQLWR